MGEELRELISKVFSMYYDNKNKIIVVLDSLKNVWLFIFCFEYIDVFIFTG